MERILKFIITLLHYFKIHYYNNFYTVKYNSLLNTRSYVALLAERCRHRSYNLPHVGNMIVLRLKHWFSVESNVRHLV